MKIYPDLLNNPDGDPRIYQQQYEEWRKELDDEEARLRDHEADAELYASIEDEG